MKYPSHPIRGFIPRHTSGNTVIRAYEWMRRRQRRKRRDYSANRAINEKVWPAHAAVATKMRGFIEDQNNYTDMRYGDCVMADVGCEVIAVYNALRLFQDSANSPSLPALITELENDGIVRGGRFGTSPLALCDVLRAHGLRTEFCLDGEHFEMIEKESDVLILTYYNDGGDIAKQVHTVCLTKETRGLVGHNVTCDGRVAPAASSLTSFLKYLNNGCAKAISLIGINRSDSKRQKGPG